MAKRSVPCRSLTPKAATLADLAVTDHRADGSESFRLEPAQLARLMRLARANRRVVGDTGSLDLHLRLAGLADVLRDLGDNVTADAMYLLAGVCDDMAAELEASEDSTPASAFRVVAR